MTSVSTRIHARKLQTLTAALRRVTVLAGVAGALFLAAGQADASTVAASITATTPVGDIGVVVETPDHPCDWPWPIKP